MSSRYYRIGSIFSRLDGFIRKGFIKYEDRPLWYDVYVHFPPKYEPKYSRPAPNIEIQEIFYPEDVARAKIQKKFNFTYDLCDNQKSQTQKMLEKYQTLISQGMSESEALDKLNEVNNIRGQVTDLKVVLNTTSFELPGMDPQSEDFVTEVPFPVTHTIQSASKDQKIKVLHLLSDLNEQPPSKPLSENHADETASTPDEENEDKKN